MRTLEQLSNAHEPLNPADTPEKKKANQLMAELAATGDENVRETLRLKRELSFALAVIEYPAIDPREIDSKTLQTLARSTRGLDATESVYKQKIKSPITAIRSFCVTCQGGSLVDVRACAAVNCPLWAFRMGVNAFFGKVSDTDAEAEAVDDTDEQENEHVDQTP